MGPPLDVYKRIFQEFERPRRAISHVSQIGGLRQRERTKPFGTITTAYCDRKTHYSSFWKCCQSRKREPCPNSEESATFFGNKEFQGLGKRGARGERQSRNFFDQRITIRGSDS